MFEVTPLPWGIDCAENADIPAPATHLVGGIPMCPACMGALVGEVMPAKRIRTHLVLLPESDG